MTDSTVIYDFGANNGDDIPYYLVKADRVVAVEANPVLAAGIKQRFTEAIAAGRLEVVAKVLTAGDDAPEVPFYVHRTNHVLSQFPSPANPAEFDRVVLPAVAVVDLIARFGAPHYIKIDIEHYDEAILRALFAANIRPPFISAESHSFEVFAALVALGGYRAFKLVDGSPCRSAFAITRSPPTSARRAIPFPSIPPGRSASTSPARGSPPKRSCGCSPPRALAGRIFTRPRSTPPTLPPAWTGTNSA